MERVYLTREGYEKLTEELEFLKNVKRREFSSAIEQARALGDLKENAEYHAAKEALAHNEARVHELEDKLSRVEIIDNAGVDANKAFLGAKLLIVDLDTSDEEHYLLVGPDEADPLEGMISVTSPVGKALLGHAVGEEIKIDVPAGILRYKIKEITR